MDTFEIVKLVEDGVVGLLKLIPAWSSAKTDAERQAIADRARDAVLALDPGFSTANSKDKATQDQLQADLDAAKQP